MKLNIKGLFSIAIFIRKKSEDDFLKKLKHLLIWLIILLWITSIMASCKKMIEVPPPISTITNTQAFESDAQAKSAISGIYSNMINGAGINIFRGALTAYSGASADELQFYNQTFANDAQFQSNTLQPTNTNISSLFWSAAFFNIYQTNAAIEGLQNSTGVHDSVKTELLGEAKFLRAFCNFYLVNLFGDIPSITTTNYRQTSLLARASQDNINDQIVKDLIEAQNLLARDYSVGKGERIIPNKWAAMSLLARVYLYKKDYANAEIQSSQIIDNTTLFSLVTNLNNVFSRSNNMEAIWQLQQDARGPSQNATPEAFRLIPRTSSFQPYVYLTTQLLNAFESGDKRKISWIDSTTFLNVKYFFPRKYKIGPGQSVTNGTISEYYVMFRLAEQFLIRAEARVKQGNLQGAIDDINSIRARAGLSNLPNSLTQQQIMDRVLNEKRIEFFAEWGHRWFDLKRWGKADEILAPIKGNNWQTTDQLYPLPQAELLSDPNLVQNEGYQ